MNATIPTTIQSVIFAVTFMAVPALSEPNDWTAMRQQLLTTQEITHIPLTGRHAGVSGDQLRIRYIPPVFDTTVYPQIGEVPLFRLIDSEAIPLNRLLALTRLTTNFDIEVHPLVDLTATVKFNKKQHPFASVEQYLEHVMSVDIGTYPEAKMIVVTPSAETLWQEH